MDIIDGFFFLLIFCRTFQLCTATDWAEDVIARVSVGLFTCCVVGFIFSVITGCFLQLIRFLTKEKDPRDSHSYRNSAPSISMAFHTDGKQSRLVRLDQLKRTEVLKEKSRDMNEKEEEGHDFRESLYASIDVTKKTRTSLFDNEKYPPVDY